MANAKLIHKKDLVSEPKYSGSENDTGSGTQACPNKNEEPVQKIKSVTLKDSKGKTIDKIDKEQEIELVIETQEMAGEELILNIGAMGGNLSYMGEAVSPDHVLTLQIKGNEEKLTFKVEPARLKGFDI